MRRRHPLQEQGAPITWSSRNAPLHKAGGTACLSWRERAALHRASLGLPPPSPRRQQQQQHPGDSGASLVLAGSGTLQARGGSKSLSIAKVPISAVAWDPSRGKDIDDDDQPEWEEGKDWNDIVAPRSFLSGAGHVVTPAVSSRSRVNDYAMDEEERMHVLQRSLPTLACRDWWGIAMRVDAQRYMAQRNRYLSGMAHQGEFNEKALEQTLLWSITQEVIMLERRIMRRHARGQRWPDIMWSVAALSQDEMMELEAKLEDSLQKLEADVSDEMRAALSSFPLDVWLRQLLADARVSTGDLAGARRVLLQAIVRRPGQVSEAGAQQAGILPLRIGWDDALDCNYLKAQQCTRFGRLSLLVREASKPGNAAPAPPRGRLADEQHSKEMAEALANARRHLIDARRLYKAELDAAAQLHHLPQAPVHSDRELEDWLLAVRCARLGSSALLADACDELGNSAEAEVARRENAKEIASLREHPSATPLLLELLAQEDEKLQCKLVQEACEHPASTENL